MLVPVGHPKDRFKYNRAMNFSSQENRCEVGESAYVPFKRMRLDKPGGETVYAELLTSEPIHEAERYREVT